LIKLANEEDEVVRRELKQLKGIGDWTADIYLLHALQRTDIFPTSDLALVNSIKMIKGIPSISKEELVQLSRPWQPYRSVATMIFWHYYIKKKNINTLI
jgi:DNA-3-methyladenine glycosylase II